MSQEQVDYGLSLVTPYKFLQNRKETINVSQEQISHYGLCLVW